MIWKDIPNFKGYQVSDTGLVRTHNKTTHTNRHGDRHWKDRILKPKKSLNGRSDDRVDLWKDGKPHCFKVSRLVAFTFYEKDINDHTLTVNHIDGNWKNNSLQNLELISLAENIKHAFDTGLMTSCNKVLLTDKQTGKTILCRSMSEAGRVMKKSNGYVLTKRKRKKYENEDYYWEIIQ